MGGEVQDKQPEENKEPKKENATPAPNPVIPPPTPKPFPPPKVLNAVVDPKEKPKEGPTPFSFTNPAALHSDMAKPAKGDIPEQPKKKTLADLDAEIAADERKGEEMDYDDYKDNAEMILDMYEGGLTWFSRWWSKDTSDSAYEFPKLKRDKLERQLTKVLRKRKTGIPIELLFAGTLIPATGQIITKASDRRKIYLAENKKVTPAAASDTSVKKEPNKRRPGRPTK